MKKHLRELKTTYKSFSGSKRFWNNCIILFAIILPFINFKLAIGAAFSASVLFAGYIIDGKENENYWWIVTPLCWLLLILAILFDIARWINNKIFKPFNMWLDEKLK